MVCAIGIDVGVTNVVAVALVDSVTRPAECSECVGLPPGARRRAALDEGVGAMSAALDHARVGAS